MRRQVTQVLLGLFAAVGGFLILLQLTWIAGFEPTWLPYVVQPVGVMIAAVALAGMSPSSSKPVAFVVGAASVGLLAFIATYAPKIFVLSAATSSSAPFAVPILALICGLAAGLGGVLGASDVGRSSLSWAAVAACFAASAMIQIGGRVHQFLDPHATETVLVVGNCVLTFLVGAAVQTIVPRRAIEAAAVGVASLSAISISAAIKHGHVTNWSEIARSAGPPFVAAALGAGLIWWRSSDRA